MDQPEWILAMLDTVEQAMQEWRKEQAENEQTGQNKEDIIRKLNARPRV